MEGMEGCGAVWRGEDRDLSRVHTRRAAAAALSRAVRPSDRATDRRSIVLRPEELEMLVCGGRELDLEALETATLYDD